MSLFKNNKKPGFVADVIRCDEPSYLIWKWHPDGTAAGENKREYAIRCGSPIRVKDGEVAVFVYKQKNGAMQDYIVGPYDETLKTANLPVLSSILGAFFGGDTPFQAEVYFINLSGVIQTRFAVPYFDIYDPRYPDFGVPVAVRGSVSFRIADYREFIKLHRLDTFTLEDFQTQIKSAISRYAKDAVASAPTLHNIPVVQIEARIGTINNALENDLKNRLRETFGVIVSAVDVSDIEIDKTSSGYRELAAITKDITTATIQGQTAANIENYAETLRIQREEGQYAMHMQTNTANIGAYQIEKQTEIGVAGANALGQMGANGAGNANLGNGGGMGFNPAAMMASMAVGGAIGQNLAATMNNAMGNVNVAANQPPQVAPVAPPPLTPPPIPSVEFHVAKDGRSAGPFNTATLAQMAASGELLPDSLVWKQGMATWEKASTVDDLKGLFPPPIV